MAEPVPAILPATKPVPKSHLSVEPTVGTLKISAISYILRLSKQIFNPLINSNL